MHFTGTSSTSKANVAMNFAMTLSRIQKTTLRGYI